MKKRILVVLFTIMCLLIIPSSLIVYGLLFPAKYDETYYGALSQMQEKLRSCGGNKIVMIGNSAVAFGVDSLQLQQELEADGIFADVCNFGLYGAIGTKAMLELAEPWIGEGDLVVFMPELNAQALSLYFSPLDFWYACDGNPALLRGMGEEASTLVGAFPGFVAEKLRYHPSGSDPGVYAAASFDENGVMSLASRDYNIMPGLVDVNAPLCFDPALISDDFIAYVNEWYRSVRDHGAEMVWYFAPVNEAALDEDYDAALDEFYETLNEKLDFPILGNPHHCVMDSRWFYDSNVHLNSAGMTAHTILLTDALKLYYEKSSPVQTQMPDYPQILDGDKMVDGDDGDAALFLYEENENGLLIVGLAAEGRGRKQLTVPCTYEGENVYAFTAETFRDNGSIEEIIIQNNVRMLYDGSFAGCGNLQKITFTQTDPEEITVGYHLLDGADGARLYVRQEAFSNFSSNYYWGHYAGRYETY